MAFLRSAVALILIAVMSASDRGAFWWSMSVIIILMILPVIVMAFVWQRLLPGPIGAMTILAAGASLIFEFEPNEIRRKIASSLVPSVIALHHDHPRPAGRGGDVAAHHLDDWERPLSG